MSLEEIKKIAASVTIPNKYFSKLFGIGFNKTGTTTLEKIFDILGYSIPKQQEQELKIVKQYHLGNFEPLKEFVSKYDAFQDLPFAQGNCYAVADALFPNSKFILTLRNSEDWFRSISAFHKKTHKFDTGQPVDENYFKDKKLYLYKNYTYENLKRMIAKVEDNKVIYDWSLAYNKQHYIKIYEDRNEQIIQYFKDRSNDLLVIDITKEKDISKILNFLELPDELNFEMPHTNKTPI